jgi:hypothetical protein
VQYRIALATLQTLTSTFGDVVFFAQTGGGSLGYFSFKDTVGIGTVAADWS